jgi:uncharacterized repeat protein (TIGR03803 family)
MANVGQFRNLASLAPVQAVVLLLALLAGSSAKAQTFSVIHSFTDTATDGGYPNAGVTIRGNALYGTTLEGGEPCPNNHRCGTVYQVTHVGSGWMTTPIFLFPSTGSGGIYPTARVVFGPDGHMYGTTSYGGASNDGVVFSLTPPLTFCKTVACFWTETLPHSFLGSPDDGAIPGYGDLIWDQRGDAYGTTTQGGMPYGGIIFQLARAGNNWIEMPIYNFDGGGAPAAGLVADSNGNLFGTTVSAGLGFGTVFELSWIPGVGWQETTLYTFQGNGQPGEVYAGLIIDSSGNLYGATYGDPISNSTAAVFELSPSGNTYTFKQLHDFGCTWCGPQANLTMDAQGNLYGTSFAAGPYMAGNVFKLTNTQNGWEYSSLHDFTGGSDGASPISTVSIDTDGTLYGTTSAGGQAGGGTIWMVKP